MIYNKYVYPIAYFLGGILLGWFLEKVLLGKLRRLANKTKWETDDVIIDSFRNMIFLWGLIAGSYLALHFLPVSEALRLIIRKFFFVLLVLSFSIITTRLIIGIIKLKTIRIPGVLPSTSIIANITRIVVYIIGVLVILQTLGISITPILTALGVGGLAVALALQDTLSNLFSGVQVIASQQIRPGDYIKLETGEEGYVADITWRNTTIRTLPNNLVIVPNSKLASAIITNYQLPDNEIAVLVEVGISYDSDLEKVERVVIEAASEIMEKIDGGVKGFKPFVRFHTFADSSINFTTILRAREFANQYVIKHEFVKTLNKRFKENAIEIPFPIRTVYLNNEIQLAPAKE